FANGLHYGRLYEEALRVLDRLLEDEPANLEALTLKADIFEHREEHAQAEELARRVLEQDGASVEAWRILADVHEAQGDWERLGDAAGRGAAVSTSACDLVDFGEQRGRALLELGRDAELASELEKMTLTPKGVSAATTLRARQLLRKGWFEEALEVAQRT